MNKPLTLTILSPKDLEQEPIVFNYEDLKGAITNIANTYKNIEYTEDQLKVAKADRATLNKFRTALETKRKEIKAMCLKPYEDFETKIKDLVALMDEPIRLIDDQVKAYEQEVTDAKLAEAKAHFEEKVLELELEKIVTWEKIFDDKFNNLTMTLKKVNDQVDEQLSRIQNDWHVLDAMDTPYGFEIKQVYVSSLDLGQALAKDQKLKRQAEEKAAYEKATAERKAKEEEDRKAKIEEKTSALAGKPFYEIADKPKQEEPLYRLGFFVTGTREELINLSNFLKNNNYKYEQIKEQ